MRATRSGVSASCVSLPSRQAGPWLTTLEYLVQRFPALSRELWLMRMVAGEVSDENGEYVTPETLFVPYRKIYYFRSVENEPPIPFAAQILFQDEHIVVADKPHFLPVVPSGRFVQETLLVRLKRQLGIDTLSPAHRIDADTAGIVLFTIDPASRDAYQRLFRERSVEKRYEAIAIAGVGTRACHDFPVVRRSRLVASDAFMQMHEVAGAENAETHIDLIARHGEFARYALRPLTGQKHQLRVHMAAIGLPIVNDRIYPELKPVSRLPDYDKPLQLLAKHLAFNDPISGEPRSFSSARTLQF